jgi:hypothetical protein
MQGTVYSRKRLSKSFVTGFVCSANNRVKPTRKKFLNFCCFKYYGSCKPANTTVFQFILRNPFCCVRNICLHNTVISCSLWYWNPYFIKHPSPNIYFKTARFFNDRHLKLINNQEQSITPLFAYRQSLLRPSQMNLNDKFQSLWVRRKPS